MEMADLRTLLVVSEQRSFTRAAALLHRSQPAVSLAVRRLEERMGTALFTRETKRPELTDAGRLLVGYAQEMWAVQGAARLALAELRGLRNGEVRIGVNETLTNALLPLVGEFRQAYPGIRVGVTPVRDDDVIGRLSRAELDLGAVDVAPPHTGFDTVVIGTDRWVLVVPPAHAWAGRPSMALSDLDDTKIIGIADDRRLDARLALPCEGHGTTAQVDLTLPSLDALKRAVEQGFGVAVLPHSAVATEIAARRLAAVPLRHQKARAVWLACSNHRTPSASAAAFFQVATQRAARRQLPHSEGPLRVPGRVARGA
jgi:DNA-binding transcriptional LysR family regulator